ncbi:MAG: type III pantothenate kinase [Phycisphaerae bacterium]
MMNPEAEAAAAAPAFVVEIGNTHTTIATWFDEQIKTPIAFPTGDVEKFKETFEAHADAIPNGIPGAVIVASVVPDFRDEIGRYVWDRIEKDTLVVGERVALPLEVDVEDATRVGVDRVCAAAAAYDKLQTGCIVVDFGTATTVDLVNDEGVFQGGAILPGVSMQLQALAEQTAQLPNVSPLLPDSFIGKNTEEAIQNGVCRGIAGAVRWLVEGYATALNRWPQVVATGGDLELLLPACDYIDTPVRDLTLRGLGVAYRKHIAQAEIK